jgi:hypothetical protein
MKVLAASLQVKKMEMREMDRGFVFSEELEKSLQPVC